MFYVMINAEVGSDSEFYAPLKFGRSFEALLSSGHDTAFWSKMEAEILNYE